RDPAAASESPRRSRTPRCLGWASSPRREIRPQGRLACRRRIDDVRPGPTLGIGITDHLPAPQGDSLEVRVTNLLIRLVAREPKVLGTLTVRSQQDDSMGQQVFAIQDDPGRLEALLVLLEQGMDL